MTSQTLPDAGIQYAGRPTIFAMAAAAGVAVANIYYSQPMLGVIATELGHDELVGLIPTATQLGYAIGLFALLPLGDILPRRGLIALKFLGLAAASVLAAMSPGVWTLLTASLLLGLIATAAQQLVPFTTLLVPPEKRGAALGIAMAGLLSGILLSRVLSGFVSEHLGWREMFWLAAPLSGVMGLVMYGLLPHRPPAASISYGAAMRSLVHLWRREPALRTATLMQAALFGTFTAFWSMLAFHLQEPQFGLGADVAGLFGILGVAGVAAAPLVGRIGDRFGPHVAIRFGVLIILASWLILAGWNSLTGLVIGVVLLDFGFQGVLVSNQHLIYALDHSARSRLNTIFMTGMFLGGAAGSAAASLAWAQFGWLGVSLLGLGLSVLGFAIRMLMHLPDGNGVPAVER